MKLKNIVTSIIGLSVIVAATLCHANSVELINNNSKFQVKEDMSISYWVLAQKDKHSPLIPKEIGTTVLKPGAHHTVNFEQGNNWRVWIQPFALNGKDIPNLKEKCKLITTKSPQSGAIGIALIDKGHTLTCDVNGGDRG
ncbi:hypothetical protein BH10PSE19_BH10PSE19_16120 [soil metagenome]